MKNVTMREWQLLLKMQNQEQSNMSNIGQWVVEMQEDAYHMDFNQFIEKHGSSQASVWCEVQDADELEPDYVEMDDGA
jgi:hypothetical protein